MAIREGAWDCPRCGRSGNRGPEKYCGGCGSPRGPEVPLYLPENAPEVTEAGALLRAKAGPDWSCAHCGGDNRTDDSFCSGCGASRDGTKQRDVVEHRFGAPAPAAEPTAPPRRLGRRLGVGLGLLVVAGALIALASFALNRKTDLTVSGRHWTRTVAVEELRTVVESAWDGEVPPGARIKGSSDEVHHVDRVRIGSQTKTRTVGERVQSGTERVQVGTRDLGNGYFEDVFEDRPVYETRSRDETYEEPVYRDQPVHRKRHRYEIEKWVPHREVRAEGEDASPAWPDPGLRENEREGRRQASYEVRFRDAKGKTLRYAPADERIWSSFYAGRSYKGRVRRSGEVAELE